MFCQKCGKELKDDWKKCPYCGQALGGDSVGMDGKMEIHHQIGQTPSEMSSSDKGLKKKGKMKKILFGIGIVLVILIIISIFAPSDDSGSSDSQEDQEIYEEIKTLEEVGGFAQWQEDGFPGRVRANICTFMQTPLKTDRNHEVFFIGSVDEGIGIIFQEDEKPISEWEWLMNAEPDEYTQVVWFNGILKYIGDADEYPMFTISDVEEDTYWEDDGIYDTQGEEDYADSDFEELMGQPEQTLKELGFTYDEDDVGYSLLDGEIYVLCDMDDGTVSVIHITGSGSNMPSFHGVKVGMSMEEADVLLTDKYSKDVELDNTVMYFDSESRNSISLECNNGEIAEIYVTRFTEEQMEMMKEEDTEPVGETVSEVANITGDFVTDVANSVLYGKDGIIVDVNGNVLAEYADYFITGEGYISNGDWVEEGYTVDDTGKIVEFQW